MTIDALAAWVLAALIWQAPPDRTAPAHARAWPSAAETVEARTERYGAIAADIAAAAVEEPEPRRAAALLIAVAVRESGLAPNVDAPTCSRERIARGYCDSGRARSIFQLQAAKPATRAEAARLALRALRRSQNACRGLPAGDTLAAY